MPYKIFPKAAVVAVGTKKRRFVVPQMGKAVRGARVAAHCFNQPRNFPRAAAHQRTFQSSLLQAVEHAGGDTDHIL